MKNTSPIAAMRTIQPNDATTAYTSGLWATAQATTKVSITPEAM